MCSAQHRINPQLQQLKMCSCASWDHGMMLLECRPDSRSATLCLKEWASLRALGVLRIWTCVIQCKKGWRWPRQSQQYAFSYALINYIQNVVLQRDVEELSPDLHLPWHSLVCHFLVPNWSGVLVQNMEMVSKPGCEVCILYILFLCFSFYWITLNIFIIFYVGNSNSEQENLQKFSNHKINRIP